MSRSPQKKQGALPVKVPLQVAVLSALYGVPYVLCAQEAPDAANGALQEVIVTAGRRQQTLEETPYNLSVVTADQLARTGVTDIASLSYQVPGLSLFDFGARFAGATSPIIRGINGDGAPLGNRMAEQSPVGTYIGNSPVDGYFQLDDVQRVEVLRGPQGTLYGAGALGGALRIIPNAPQLGVLAGHLDIGGGSVAHSSGASYMASGMLNVPIGDTLAFRVSGKYQYDPGFINVYGILERSGSSLSGIPTLAEPADPVNSPGIYEGRKDWNFQRAVTARSSLLWKPVDAISAEVAYVYAKVNGDGGPQVNSTFPGGAYPVDPRTTFPAGGNYQEFSAIDQPFDRETSLTSLDLSYDAGFATLSTTTSYFTTQGATVTDDTYGQALYTFSYPYYSGNPTNPRFISPFEFDDTEHSFTQEVRLVSKTSPDKRFDYVVGLFYESQGRARIWDISAPGSPEYSAAEGCTSPYVAGAGFPACQVVAGPGDLTFSGVDHQQFKDKSVFGELTWHVTQRGQLTFGGRHFKQEFTDAQSYLVYTFASSVPAIPRESDASKNIWKVNTSYEYADQQYVYATWSQGFRRGGANSVPLTGPFRESPLLATYAPDSTNNYELGLKGRLFGGWSYSVDVFDVLWNNPQIAGITPAGNYAVWNAAKARSDGVEFDLSGPLPLSGFSLTVGGAYSNAKLTEDYSLPAGNGAGTVEPGLITGTSGSQLPGSPKISVAATVAYERILVPGYTLNVSLNDTYKSSIPFQILIPGNASDTSSASNIANLSATLDHRPWHVTGYVKNITDKRVLLIPSSGPVGNLYDNSTINRPREIGMQIGVSF